MTEQQNSSGDLELNPADDLRNKKYPMKLTENFSARRNEFKRKEIV